MIGEQVLEGSSGARRGKAAGTAAAKAAAVGRGAVERGVIQRRALVRREGKGHEAVAVQGSHGEGNGNDRAGGRTPVAPFRGRS